MARPGGERAVSPIIGAVILLGFIVAAMAVHQAQVVPRQNAEIEFNHNERVEDDMVSVRNAVLQAHESGENQFVTVELGTSYPARLVGVNPPHPSGRIHSTNRRPIVVENETNVDVTTAVCPGGQTTRYIEYDPSYNEYRTAPSFRYENSLVYKEFPTRPVNLTMTGQQLVADSSINLYRITGNYSLQGQGAVSFDVNAGTIKRTSVEEPTVTVPTELPETKWEEILRGQVDPANVTVSAGNLTVSPAGNYEIRCSPVEISEEGADDESTPTPTSTATATATPNGPEASFDNGANSNVFVVKVSQPYGSGSTNPKVDVTFENRHSQSKKATSARFLTYYDASTGQNKPIPARMKVAKSTPWLNESDPRQSLDSPFSIPGNGERSVQLYFKGSDNGDSGVDLDDYVILTLVYEDGTASVYFVEFDGSN